MSAIPGTDERVPQHTPHHVNQTIRQQTRASIKRYEGAAPAEIDSRIAELQREWDVERTLEANASSISLVGLALGVFVNRRFLALPAVVAAFLLQHAIQGWCPPLPILRRLGVRTAKEIHEEIVALRVLRGDFKSTDDADTAFSQAHFSRH